jgi:hypothetical protein
MTTQDKATSSLNQSIGRIASTTEHADPYGHRPNRPAREKDRW